MMSQVGGARDASYCYYLEWKEQSVLHDGLEKVFPANSALGKKLNLYLPAW